MIIDNPNRNPPYCIKMTDGNDKLIVGGWVDKNNPNEVHSAMLKWLAGKEGE